MSGQSVRWLGRTWVWGLAIALLSASTG
ncbi:MAG: hypothetical protein RLY70_4090, partial [Planctomycetota bacterium]